MINKNLHKKTVYVISLGCPKNLVDTETMLGSLALDGYVPTQDPLDATVLLVNTCGFLLSAREESVNTILDIIDIKEQTGALLVAVGCMVEHNEAELAESIPEVDIWLGVGHYSELGGLVREALRLSGKLNAKLPYFAMGPDQGRILSGEGHRAYVKLAEGCSMDCAFCKIPQIRGKQVSRPMEEIIKEIEELSARGVKEITLIAQNLCTYGSDLYGHNSLAVLLKKIDQCQCAPWIRLLYLYPLGLTAELIETIAKSKHILPYIDLPLQTISDHLLKDMRRHIGEARTRDLVRRLKEKIPNLWLRSTFIVGLPGETEEDFENLCAFVKECSFDHLGVFAFSPEEGTLAAALPNQVPAKIGEKRAKKLMAIQKALSKKKLATYRHKKMTVLVEGYSEESDLLLAGRHVGQAPDGIDGVVYINEGEANIGDLVEVEIVQTGDYDLVGRICENE